MLTPGVLSLGLGWYGSLARAAAREAGAAGAAGAVGAGALTEYKVGSGLLQQGGWLDRWAQFWKLDRDASITWGAASPILGGLWSIGRVERLLINDARFSVAWFDALAHESVHILSGTLLWPIKGRINGGVGELMFGWMRFGEEFVAYNVGRLVVGRLHGMGPMAAYNAYQSLAMSTPMVLSVVFFLPMEIVAGGYLYQKFWHRR